MVRELTDSMGELQQRINRYEMINQQRQQELRQDNNIQLQNL